ncbi:hypothetical protein JTE90_024062 [Oedothorax gibbosus]|uniref:Uncharacterized protein n=1 Tax=Oedothorax gibbosus TaxID=931172 RepID=A0AAV6TD98_9ARAC|nr:hypothetical protein JTE90_024062 [Oedothorax gibbosus]
MKVQAGGGGRIGIPVPRGPGRTPVRPAASLCWKWRSLSAHVGTRRWCELCRTGRGQRETLVEVRSGFDGANPDRQTGSSGRKTNRTI